LQHLGSHDTINPGEPQVNTQNRLPAQLEGFDIERGLRTAGGDRTLFYVCCTCFAKVLSMNSTVLIQPCAADMMSAPEFIP
jgi:hypothetical protein